MIRFSILVLAGSLLASIASAHPGHGDPAHATGLVHHLITPEHGLVGLAAALTAGAGFRLWRRGAAS